MRQHRRLVVLLAIMTITSLGVSSVSETFMSTSYAVTLGVSSLTGESYHVGQYINSTPRRLDAGEDRSRILYLSNSTTLRSIAERIGGLVDCDTIRAVANHISSSDNRYTGTIGSLAAISYINEFLKSNCSIQDVLFDNFTFNDQGVQVEASNIIAKISPQQRSDKTMIVTAHHDSIGYQYPVNVYSQGARGSDDDASGVGALLETARLLSMFRNYLRYNVLFIVFAAEEGNKTLDPTFLCQGSAHWTSTDHIGVNKLSDIIGTVNLDGVAYENGGLIGIFHHDSGSSVASNVSTVAAILNIPARDELGPRHDSYLKPVRCRTEDTFDAVQIPTITLSSHYTNPFTHTNLDTLSYLDFDFAYNFTRVVASYVFLTVGTLPERVDTYTASWGSTVSANSRFEINESNYFDVIYNPGIIGKYDLVILDPSLSGININHLLSITSACAKQGKRLPILSVGKVNRELLRALNLTQLEYVEQDSSTNDLVAYVGGSITDVGSHPVLNSPNNFNFTFVNSTHLGYTVLKKQSRDNSYCLIRNSTKSCLQLLQLSYTPSLSGLWSWLALLHDEQWGCGPIAFIGVNNGSSITNTAGNITQNMIFWLLNGTATASVVRVSDMSPLVGSHIKITVAVRNSLTWTPNAYIPVMVSVYSPSGGLLLGELRMADKDGVIESSAMLVREIGEHQIAVAANLTGAPIKATVHFRSYPRIIVQYENRLIQVTQGESAIIRLNLTYLPPASEELILELTGKPLSSNVSVIRVLEQGYNNSTFGITTRETIQADGYNLTFSAMPSSKEYVACSCIINILVTPAYEVNILDSPKQLDQLSTSQLLVKVKSHRSVPVNCSLRVESLKLTFTGEASFTISSGEIKLIELPITEASSSPYVWGEGEFRISVVKNSIAVVDSQLITIFVSLNPLNLTLGYILPIALPIATLLERSKKMRATLAASGILIGGYTFFGIGLVVYQSAFMVVPLSMLVVGSYLGTIVMEQIYDLPLPKEYNWLIPSNEKDENHDHGAIGKDIWKQSLHYSLPKFCFAGINELLELERMKKYREIVPAAYSLASSVMADLVAGSAYTPFLSAGDKNDNKTKGGCKTLTRLFKQLERRRISVPGIANLRELERLHRKHTKYSRKSSTNSTPEHAIECMAQGAVSLVAEFISKNKDKNPDIQ